MCENEKCVVLERMNEIRSVEHVCAFFFLIFPRAVRGTVTHSSRVDHAALTNASNQRKDTLGR